MHKRKVLALKCTFTPQVAKLGIRAVYNTLLKDLRCELGDNFLNDERFVVAYPARRSLFLENYAYNFPSVDIDSRTV